MQGAEDARGAITPLFSTASVPVAKGIAFARAAKPARIKILQNSILAEVSLGSVCSKEAHTCPSRSLYTAASISQNSRGHVNLAQSGAVNTECGKRNRGPLGVLPAADSRPRTLASAIRTGRRQRIIPNRGSKLKFDLRKDMRFRIRCQALHDSRQCLPGAVTLFLDLTLLSPSTAWTPSRVTGKRSPVPASIRSQGMDIHGRHGDVGSSRRLGVPLCHNR